MGAKMINEPQLYCEDIFGNFTGMFKQGDCIRVKYTDGKIREGSIDNIFSDSVELDTEDYGFIEISFNDIEEVEVW
jgi:hypothetical protein